MTEYEINELVEDVKAYLGVTWTDDVKENQYRMFIKGSAKRLESIYGYSLDFVDDPEEAMNPDHPEDNALARELLLNRCFYMNEKALDDFEPNYRGELNALKLHGSVRKVKESKDAA